MDLAEQHEPSRTEADCDTPSTIAPCGNIVDNGRRMSPLLDPVDLRHAACDLARLGGRAATRLFGKVIVHRKADNSPVTEADHVAQNAMLRALSERYPEHAVLVEESLESERPHPAPGTCEYCWVIDPVDGTRNFARGVRVYASSVAVLHRGRPVAGAVYDATSDAVYSAALGAGAFRDEAALLVTESPIGRESAVAVGSFRRQPMPPAVTTWLERYTLRNVGSTCLHLAWIAAGLMDAAYSNECKLWDVAAASLIVEEAGGRATDERGRPLWPCRPADYSGEDVQILAGAPALHEQLRASLQ